MLSAVTMTASTNMDCVPPASAKAMRGSTLLPLMRVTTIDGGAGSVAARHGVASRENAASAAVVVALVTFIPIIRFHIRCAKVVELVLQFLKVFCFRGIRCGIRRSGSRHSGYRSVPPRDFVRLQNDISSVHPLVADQNLAWRQQPDRERERAKPQQTGR